MKKKLVLLVPYFGSFPNYFQLFLDSCNWNPCIDWIIFTDINTTNYKIPENVKIINLTLTDVNHLIAKKIGNFKIKKAYKLCDFRPAYGLIFENYIKNYNYWGHCDIDIIFGNLEKFVLPNLEKNYSRIFRFGHFTIYKNSENVNNFFRQKYSGINYRLVFKTSVSCAFDEEKGTWKLAQENKFNICDENISFDIKIPGKQSKLITAQDNYERQAFILNKGRAIRIFIEDGEIKYEERGYFHFQKREIKLFPPHLYKNEIYQIGYNYIKLIESIQEEKLIKENIDLAVRTIKNSLKYFKNVINFQYIKFINFFFYK